LGKKREFREKQQDVSQDPIADEKWIWKEAKGGEMNKNDEIQTREREKEYIK